MFCPWKWVGCVAGAGVTFGLCWGWWMACFGLLGVGVVERDKSDLIGVGVVLDGLMNLRV